MKSFEETYGFQRSDLRLENWRMEPFSRFAFQHAREILPTATISCGIEREEMDWIGEGALCCEQVMIGDRRMAVADFLHSSHTDIFVVMKAGRIVAEWRAAHAKPQSPHILFSVTKSVTGLLAGILEHQGVVDMAAHVSRYLPEAAQSGFGDATLQQLADMQTSLRFDESYLNVDGDYARYRRATGWNPPGPADAGETMTEFLMSIGKGDRPHGVDFQYASPNTDVLGLVLERAASECYVSLVSELIWQPLQTCRHAYMTLDRAGAPRPAGGMCATARDLARLAEAIRTGGQGPGGRIVPQRWVEDMLSGGDANAWRAGNFADFLENGSYRNCWYLTGNRSGA